MARDNTMRYVVYLARGASQFTYARVQWSALTKLIKMNSLCFDPGFFFPLTNSFAKRGKVHGTTLKKVIAPIGGKKANYFQEHVRVWKKCNHLSNRRRRNSSELTSPAPNRQRISSDLSTKVNIRLPAIHHGGSWPGWRFITALTRRGKQPWTPRSKQWLSVPSIHVLGLECGKKKKKKKKQLWSCPV